MKKRKLLSVFAAFAVFCGVQSSFAFLDWGNFYIGGSGAASFQQPVGRTFINMGGVPGFFGITEFKAGGRGAACLGYQLGFIRVEAEGAFRQQTLDKAICRVPGVGNRTDLNIDYFSRIYSAMGNLYIDIPLRDNISIYVGGGAGVASYRLNIDMLPNIFDPRTDRKETLFAWQVMGGFSYAVTEIVDLYCGYRFFAVEKPDDFVNPANFVVSYDKFPFCQEAEAGFRIKL